MLHLCHLDTFLERPAGSIPRDLWRPQPPARRFEQLMRHVQEPAEIEQQTGHDDAQSAHDNKEDIFHGFILMAPLD
jgi:hypothetical protein